jgi:type VI protein secretion system component Hcp
MTRIHALCTGIIIGLTFAGAPALAKSGGHSNNTSVQNTANHATTAVAKSKGGKKSKTNIKDISVTKTMDGTSPK